jgi:alkylation response protein AidB-like acyl-CoA dehydrogenase
MTRDARHQALVQQVEEAHQALQASLANLKVRIEASDAGLYPAGALAADLEQHAELTRRWTAAMSELARFYRDVV